MGLFGSRSGISLQPDAVPNLWGWFDVSDNTKVAGSNQYIIDKIYDKRGIAGFNRLAGSAGYKTAINGRQAVQLTGTNYFALMNPNESDAIREPITTGVSNSWNVFVVGQYSSAGTIISQNNSETLNQRQMQVFRQASGLGIGGYLTTTVLRGVDRSINDNQDLNPDGFQPILTHFQIDNSVTASPNVKISGGSNYEGYGTLSVAQALEATPYIIVGARRNGNLTPAIAAYITGKLGEIVIYNSTLTSTQRLGIKRYLADKWGLIEATQP